LIDEVKNLPNLILLRTFSKAWGLAGIRLGYCIANEEIIKILFKVKAPYNINSLTRYVVARAVENYQRKDEFVKHLLKERKKLSEELEKLPIVQKIYNSDANFLLIKFKDVEKIKTELFNKGIIVRDRSNQPKLKNCIRISVGTKAENDFLIQTIKSLK